MKYLMGLLLLSAFLSVNASQVELDSTQLESLNECEYFKYTQCTGAGLNTGACIKKKYSAFSAACGAPHAEKFTYSREMFVPKVAASSKKESCSAAQSRLCSSSAGLLSSCVSKHAKEISAACGEDFTALARKTTEADECFKLREKHCGKDDGPSCDASFEKKAPKSCFKVPTANRKSVSTFAASEAKILEVCMPEVKAKCKINQADLMRDDIDVVEYMRKYQICVKRSMLSPTGKCKSVLPNEEQIKKELSKK